MFIKEAFKKIYKGENIFSKHLTLFSVCGMLGLFDAYVVSNGITNLESYEKFFYVIVWVLFSMFFIGYETLFLHDRSLPETDLNSFKIVLNKPLMFVFAVGILLVFAKVFPEYLFIAMLLELFLAVPLTAVQAGFSYNFDSDSVSAYVKNFSLNDYIVLLLKRILIFICAYIFISLVIFIIFFVFGFVVGFGSAFLYKIPIQDISLMVGSFQAVIVKLSNYISSIISVYVFSICSLVWDYELIKTKERENGNF